MVFQKDSPSSWLYLAVTLLMMMTVTAFHGSSGIFVAILIEHFNTSNAKAGWVSSIVLFLLFSLCPLVMHLHQSLGFRLSMAIAGFFYVFSFLASSFMSNINFIYLTFSIPFGIAISFVVQLSIRTQREYFKKFYGIALGFRYGAISIGIVAMSFYLPKLYEEFGFKRALLFYLTFSPVFVIISLVSRTHLDDTRNQTGPKNGFEKLNIYQEFFKDKSFVLCLAGTTVFFLTKSIPMIFMVRYGITLGYPLSKAKWLLIMRNITTFPSRLIVGYLSGIAFKHEKVKLLAQIVYPIFGVTSFLCSFFNSFRFLLAYMGLIGIIDAAFWVTLSLYVDEITGGYHSNDAYGLICFTSALTTLIGPPLAGWIFDLTGDFRYVFYSVFVVSLFAGLLLVLSSCVKVKKELSLIEKGSKKKEIHILNQSVDDKWSVVYETSI